MEQRIRRLHQLNEAGRAMSAILDPDQLLDRILELVDEVFQFANCAILLYDEAADELFILKARGYDREVVRTFRVRPGEGVTGAVLASGSPVFVPDVLKDERYIRGVAGAHAEIAVPLVVDELVIGVLDAETTGPGDFGPDDIDLFSLFASQAATAIHNARLHYRVALHAKLFERRTDQLGLLLAATQRLVDGSGATEAEDVGLAAAAEALECDAACILLASGDDQRLRVAALTGGDLFGDTAPQELLPIGPVRDALESGEEQVVASLRRAPLEWPGFPGAGSLLLSPMRHRGRTVGVLLGYRGIADEPTEMDIALFSGFSALLALAQEQGSTKA